jgi:hypothetical protein
MAVKTFTTGEVLTAADTNTYLNNGGLVYITGASFSAVTEVLLDNVFTATYRDYRFVFDCQSSAGGAIFGFHVRSGGSTISTNTYQHSTLFMDGTSITTARSTTQPAMRVGANDTNAYHGMTLDIFCPQLAQPTRVTSLFNRGIGYQPEMGFGGNTNSTAYDGMRIYVGSGTMTGEYVLYGCRKA